MTPLEFARDKHEGSVRKFTGLPYIVHCCNVASICSLYAQGVSEVVETAYLHDTIEDTDTTFNELVDLFGYDVADSVVFLTNVDKSAGNRAKRKALDNDRLANSNHIAQTVKLADILDNVPSMLLHKPEFGKRHLREKLDTLKILDRANPVLLELTRDYLSELKSKYGDK